MHTYNLITWATEATTHLYYYCYIRISSMPTYLLITQATEATTHFYYNYT